MSESSTKKFKFTTSSFKSAKILSPEILHQIFSYEPDTGFLYWKERPREHFIHSRNCSGFNTQCAGKRAGSVDSNGYLSVFVTHLENRCKFFVHHLALILSGYELVDGLVTDHVNGDRQDNRLENLRQVSHRDNTLNRTINRNNTTGYTGVYYTRYDTYAAFINVGSRRLNLGTFKTKEEAVEARQHAEEKYRPGVVNKNHIYNYHKLDKNDWWARDAHLTSCETTW